MRIKLTDKKFMINLGLNAIVDSESNPFYDQFMLLVNLMVLGC